LSALYFELFVNAITFLLNKPITCFIKLNLLG
jgi:hypothetical protein